MFKYLMILLLGAGVIYTAQHPELLSTVDSSGPDFKVWINQTLIPPNDDPYNILNVQSREEKPLVLKSVVMNDDPKCVNMSLSGYAGASVKLGEVLRFPLGLANLTACEPVKVVIKTNRGEAVYQFR